MLILSAVIFFYLPITYFMAKKNEHSCSIMFIVLLQQLKCIIVNQPDAFRSVDKMLYFASGENNNRFDRHNHNLVFYDTNGSN